MKYCPYSGELLLDENAPFCAECGKQIPERKSQTNDTNPDIIVETEALEQYQDTHQDKTIPEESEGEPAEFRACYDGYYDDVVPDDHGNIRTVVDKQLIKKIAVLGISVILIIGACIAIMYIL